MATPIASRYQEILGELQQGKCPPAAVARRLSELVALLDLTTSLGGHLSAQEILDAVLLTVMGRLGATQGCLYVRAAAGQDELRAARGFAGGAPARLAVEDLAGESVVERSSGRLAEVFAGTNLELLCPITKAGRRIAVLGVGPAADGRRYGEDELSFLQGVAASAATPIENGLIQDELRRVNRRLSVKVYQLRNLFEISRELTSSFDEESVKSLTVTTVMGHLMVSRCALYLNGAGGLSLAHERGLHLSDHGALIGPDEAQPVLAALRGPMPTDDLPPGMLKQRLGQHGLVLLVPLGLGPACEGFLGLGARASGTAFSEEDFEFVSTLGRQALAALENVRLQRVQIEKQRQDRELQIAREIQRSLFPPALPSIPGYAVAAEMRPCYEVGGDYYDAIPIGAGRWALLIADVSGKGVPASILMASLHASLHALAGQADPAATMARLNRFLFESTQPSKFATLVYGELDAGTGRLSYVNAGHVPPYHLSAGGRVRRLEEGGTAVGLIEGATYDSGTVDICPGDLVAMFTDGATEARSPGDEELGDERVLESIRSSSGRGAGQILEGVFRDVMRWTGEAGCADDLTALILKAL